MQFRMILKLLVLAVVSLMILAALCYLVPVLAVEAVHDYKVKHAHR